MKVKIPEEFDAVRERVARFVAPIKPADSNTCAQRDFLLKNIRAVDAKELPEPYYIYFMLVELLGFEDLGRFEKIAWSIPVDYNGRAYLIEHRKFGVGIFVQERDDFDAANEILRLIKKGVLYAQPYYKWKAADAVNKSRFNVTNNSQELLERYEYLRGLYNQKIEEVALKKDEKVVKKHKNGVSVHYPVRQLRKEASWLAMSAIDAFFSWTEHFLVHMSIIKCATKTGGDFTNLSGSEWGVKFKKALDISDKHAKRHFDKLVEVRKQQRNFIAHGAFGKNGETLLFHSAAGAVPVTLDVTQKRPKFMVSGGLEFDSDEAFIAIDDFIKYVSTGNNQIPWLYVQDWCLPVIISMAVDGTYAKAIESFESMNSFVRFLANQMDDAANMDW